MATTKLYLDIRSVEKDRPAPLKVCITKHGHAAYINLDIRLTRSQWDKKAQKVVEAPNKTLLNTYISNRKVQIDNALLELASRGELYTTPSFSTGFNFCLNIIKTRKRQMVTALFALVMACS